jgi:hypothetical protein
MADATPRRFNRRNCWSLVSNERNLAQFIALVKYRSRKAMFYKNERSNFLWDVERSSLSLEKYEKNGRIIGGRIIFFNNLNMFVVPLADGVF